MVQKVLSIYIENDVTRICEVERKSAKNVVLCHAIEIRTPQGCIEDGLIVDAKRLADEMKNGIYGTKFGTNKLMFTIASKRIATKEILLPYMKISKIDEVIHSSANDYFPMSNVADYVFGYSLLETVHVNNLKKHRISAVAVPKEVVESYYELAKELNMPIENIDYFGNSVLRLLSLQMKQNVGLVLQMEKEQTVVHIMNGSTLMLQRSIPFGKDTLISTLMETKGIKESKAKHLISDTALLEQEVQEERITEEEYAGAFGYLLGSVDRIIEYYKGRENALQIEEIILLGEGSTVIGLDILLAREFGVSVNKFSSLTGVTIKETASLEAEKAHRYLANIGAVIAPVCLALHKEAEEKKMDSFKLLYYGMMAAAGVAILVISITAVRYYIKSESISELEVKIESLGGAKKTYTEYNERKEKHTKISEIYEMTKNPNEYLYEFILEMEDRMPSDTQFDNIASSEGELSITGRTKNKDEIAELIIQMKESEFIEEIFVSSITDNYGVEDSKERVSSFTLTCIIKNGEEGENENETNGTR